MTLVRIILLSIVFTTTVNADNPRFHHLEKYCVFRDAAGMLQGQIIECSCEWGYKHFEINQVSMVAGGMTIPSNQHTITIGPDVTTINPDTNQAIVAQIPNYDAMVDALGDGDLVANNRILMESMGSTYTGQMKEVAGNECEIVTNPTMGDMCITEDGITLELIMMGGTMTQVATSLDTDTCGDMANYEVPDGVNISEGPDIADLLQQLQNAQPE